MSKYHATKVFYTDDYVLCHDVDVSKSKTRVVGNFELKSHCSVYTLFELDDADKQFIADTMTKPAKGSVFRAQTRKMQENNISILVAVNMESCIIYFMSAELYNDDQNLSFETKGNKVRYLNIIKELKWKIYK